jgi:hypothetical protein
VWGGGGRQGVRRRPSGREQSGGAVVGEIKERKSPKIPVMHHIFGVRSNFLLLQHYENRCASSILPSIIKYQSQIFFLKDPINYLK